MTTFPIDCEHTRPLFVQSSSGGPPHRAEYVTVCPDCGRFRVSAAEGGVTTVVTFDLPTRALVRAAGRYVLHLDKEERIDHAAVACDLWYRWIRGKRRSVVDRLSEMDPIDAAVVGNRLEDHFSDMDRAEWRRVMERRSDWIRGITNRPQREPTGS